MKTLLNIVLWLAGIALIVGLVVGILSNERQCSSKKRIIERYIPTYRVGCYLMEFEDEKK